MKTWKLEDARNRFSEVVRRAMDQEPQLVTRHGREAAVVIGVEEYRRLTAPRNLLQFLQDSPFSKAVAEGELELERPKDYGRDVDL
ncbi:MAG: type II toxin-antitoxin system Phd/YefM family antitoxin [Longimicrobiales bacterium]|nr:type II toxin-antitoxin system Phd/YefM family antitoxin [Longimicrobiales bacterium]